MAESEQYHYRLHKSQAKQGYYGHKWRQLRKCYPNKSSIIMAIL